VESEAKGCATSSPTSPLRALMVCAAGMSSSLVEAHIREAAESIGLALELHSMSTFELDHTEIAPGSLDAVLVAPQVRFLRRGIERRCAPLGISVVSIDPMDFGMADGRAILDKLQAALRVSPKAPK
jgi:PTS system cellobiose-specific IIB component